MNGKMDEIYLTLNYHITLIEKKWYKWKDLSRCFGTTYSKGNPNMHTLPWWPEKSPCGYGKPAWVLVLIICVLDCACQQDTLSFQILGVPHLAQVGYIVIQFFDEFHLPIQVMSLNEVTQVGVTFVSGKFVQFQ